MAKRFLLSIYWDEDKLFNRVPADEMNDLNAAHIRFNSDLRKSGHYIEAEALEPARGARVVRSRGGKLNVSDGPFAEAKELVAGFYLIEASDMDEAVEIAGRIPSLTHAAVEVREIRKLIVDGKVAN
ncbi:MAG TPA: YciI family protein [Gemmatimonadaceae bacterium]|nr:YciI family protein [Gemmatimonadaceae bacterium]